MRGDGHERLDAPYNGAKRRADGFTVFASSKDGRRRSWVLTDVVQRPALREVASEIDAMEGDWHIDCISSPTSIWRDLQGHREMHAGGKHKEGPASTRYPEEQLLGQIGRSDLWWKNA